MATASSMRAQAHHSVWCAMCAGPGPRMSVGTPPSAVTPGVVARSHSAPLWPHIGSFAAGDIEYHPRGTLEPLRTRQCGNDKGANAALHVGRATSPQPAVLHETAVGRHAPGLGPERNGI